MVCRKLRDAITAPMLHPPFLGLFRLYDIFAIILKGQINHA